MNKLIIIGNLTRDPEYNSTASGKAVCNFTVAVNKRTRSDHPESDYFRVTAWEQLGENCARYLAKGKKVCVVGPVSAKVYTNNNGESRVNLEVTANEVEFLSPAREAVASAPSGYAPEDDERPY